MKRKTMRKLTGFVAIFMIAAMLLTGCSSSSAGGETVSGSTATSTSGSDTTGEKEAAELSYWVSLGAKNVSAGISDYNELACFQIMEEATNVHLNFEHPAVGQEKERFNLMVVSGELPDMVEYDWSKYPGGMQKAAQDGLIVRLNEAIEQYAPNLQKFIDEHPDIARQFTADDGSIYCIPAVAADGRDYVGGFMVRQDWLEELGLEAPETMDDWTEMLRAFKEKKGTTAAFTAEGGTFLSATANVFAGAYGVSNGWYRDGETVKYGPIEPGYKDYLQQMNAWYKEGLLDPDFAANDRKAVDTRVLNDQSGALYGLQQGHMMRYLSAKADTDFNLAGVQFPVLNEGDEPVYGRKSREFATDGSVVVTTACENIEAAMRIADFVFSEEGKLAMTFGVEGVTYELVDGKPVFTELVTNNPDGKAATDVICEYAIGGQTHPGYCRVAEYQDSMNVFTQQAEAMEVWAKYADNIEAFDMPKVSRTPEEDDQYSKIMADIESYVEEMTTKFILGTEPIESFEQFVENVKTLKIEEAIQIQQDALDRYNAR